MYRVQALKISTAAAALGAFMLLAVGEPASAAATMVLSYPNGFASSGGAVHITGHAVLAGSVIDLTTNDGVHEAGAAWYTTPQNIQSFTSDFTFNLDPSTYGMWFVVQNSNSSTNEAGYYGINAVADANGEGFGDYSFQDAAIGNSVGLKFDLTGFNGNVNFPSPSTTGIYVNGGPTNANFAPASDLLPLGINLHSGHVMAAHVVYDGTLMTMVLKDTATGNQARLTWPINIPAIVGGNSAFVGFTAGRIAAVNSALLSWSYYTGYNTRLNAPTFSLGAGSYTGAQSVSLSASSGASIYYTTDGTLPTTSSKLYTGAISVGSSEVVQAVAVQSGNTDSLVATANYQIAPSGAPIINFPSGFSSASNLISLTGMGQFSGSNIKLTDTSTYNEVAAAWYVVPVNVASFNTTFTMQITNPMANGMAFVVQNAAAATSRGANSGGPSAIGTGHELLGWGGSADLGGGFMKSIAVIFDMYNGSGDLTGLYKNGASPTGSSVDMSSSGVSLHSGNPLSVNLNYNGTTLAMTITDTKSGASFSQSWPIDIPGTVGGGTAYVGFTAATGGQNANQQLLSWTYATAGQASLPVPAAPTGLKVR